MHRLRRCLAHFATTHFTLRRCFPAQLLADIDAAISASEQEHLAEIRFAIETALPIGHLWRGTGSRERAVEVFAQLGMSDTRGRNGTLVYVLLAEREMEIVVDREFSCRVSAGVWEEICSAMAADFRKGDYGSGCLQAIRRLNALAVLHFPAAGHNRDELPNRPVLL